MRKLIFGFVLLVLGCASLQPKPQPTQCQACDLYKNPETVLLCKQHFCGASPTATFVAPQPTVAPTQIQKPTNTPVPSGMNPPIVSFVNGCNAGDPNSVDPNTGRCEFNIWEKLQINDPTFIPPCSSSDCPQVWHPQGMGLACDHMYADQGASAAVFEPKIGKWVTIMYYVCSGRLWDWVSDFDVHAVPPSHDCVGGETGNCVSWKSRTWRSDPYNGTIAGHGQYVVCLPGNAYSCKNANDLNDPNVYNTGICPSGNIPLPGAGTCTGPYTVNR